MHYVRHVRDVHRQWRPYLCHNCGKAFKRPDALKQHSLLHSTPGANSAFQCRVCAKICHSRAHLKGIRYRNIWYIYEIYERYRLDLPSIACWMFFNVDCQIRTPSSALVGEIIPVRNLRSFFQNAIGATQTRRSFYCNFTFFCFFFFLVEFSQWKMIFSCC